MADEKKSRMIMLASQITKETVKPIIEEILKINKEDAEKEKTVLNYKREPIELIINSNGGSVYDGMAVMAAMDSSITPVHTYIYGQAMSMGFAIAVCGHRRFASKYANLMYHQMSAYKEGMIYDIFESLEQTLRLQNRVDEIIISKTSVTHEKIDEVNKLKQNWYMFSDEALNLNIIDEIF